ATQFVTDFLFTLLPCNPNSVSYIEKNNLETKIYPNPSYGTININSNELIRSIRVFNSIGAEVFSKSIRSKIVQLNNLDPGVHLIILEGENNKKKIYKISVQ
ncbi:MAG: T9SS type A sorting domain-containing protein, partial [Bacteroidota bacterium]|nr:T9SS type A sorting domain-containing protein [Bacteroidota bacterium]